MPRYRGIRIVIEKTQTNGIKIMSLFCKHDWVVLSETTTDSKLESTMKTFKEAGKLTDINIPHQLSCADRKHIQVFACNKCGKLKRFVENI